MKNGRCILFCSWPQSQNHCNNKKYEWWTCYLCDKLLFFIPPWFITLLKMEINSATDSFASSQSLAHPSCELLAWKAPFVSFSSPCLVGADGLKLVILRRMFTTHISSSRRFSGIGNLRSYCHTSVTTNCSKKRCPLQGLSFQYDSLLTIFQYYGQHNCLHLETFQSPDP